MKGARVVPISLVDAERRLNDNEAAGLRTRRLLAEARREDCLDRRAAKTLHAAFVGFAAQERIDWTDCAILMVLAALYEDKASKRAGVQAQSVGTVAGIVRATLVACAKAKAKLMQMEAGSASMRGLRIRTAARRALVADMQIAIDATPGIDNESVGKILFPPRGNRNSYDAIGWGADAERWQECLDDSMDLFKRHATKLAKAQKHHDYLDMQLSLLEGEEAIASFYRARLEFAVWVTRLIAGL